MVSISPKKNAETTNLPPNESIQLVSFRVGSEDFGIDIQQVQEIKRVVEITKAPRTRPYVTGVMNLRGKIVPAVDLRRRFGLAEKQADGATRTVIVDVEGHIMGLVVDSVSEVVRIPLNAIEPPPEPPVSVAVDCVKGVASLEDGRVTYLDLQKTLDIFKPATKT